jgi:hypothetical protein
MEQILQTYDKVMHLKIFVDNNNELKKMYLAAAENHNNKCKDPSFLNAGFDLYAPGSDDDDQSSDGQRCFGTGWEIYDPVNKVDFKIQCAAQMYTDNNKIYNTGFYMYPRSSISKTNLRLANSVGIIDAGYRGNIMGMFDIVNIDEAKMSKYMTEDYIINKYDRLVQICAPGLVPIIVEVVDKVEELGEKTERGSGGFGSTGR